MFISKTVLFPWILLILRILFFFFLMFWNILFSLYHFILSRNLNSLPSFPITDWFISSSCIFCFSCVTFLFFPQTIPEFFLCFYSFSVFLTSISWWALTWVWWQVSSSLQDFSQYSGWPQQWMVSAHLPISNSSSPLSKLLAIVPSAPITCGITVTFMFHIFS